jgi:hypothetical protein
VGRNSPPLATFPEAPLRSRTVGFPESGSGLGPARHFSGRAFPHDAKLRCWHTLRPDAVEFASPLRHDTGPAVLQLSVWLRTHRRGHRVPRAPLPGAGVTRAGAASRPPGGALPPRRRSYGLMRQTIPLPAPPVSRCAPGSLQVVASPCWQMALPDIISATLVQALGPIPRRAPRLRSSIPSPRTPASPHGKRVRRAGLSPPGSFRGEPYFVAAVIRSPSGSCTRSAPRLLRPQRTRAGPPGLSHHASPGRLPAPGCGVASRSTWTTDVTGLSPAGSQPCRLLPPHPALHEYVGWSRFHRSRNLRSASFDAHTCSLRW